jgi:hypothetical protein
LAPFIQLDSAHAGHTPRGLKAALRGAKCGRFRSLTLPATFREAGRLGGAETKEKKRSGEREKLPFEGGFLGEYLESINKNSER